MLWRAIQSPAPRSPPPRGGQVAGERIVEAGAVVGDLAHEAVRPHCRRGPPGDRPRTAARSRRTSFAARTIPAIACGRHAGGAHLRGQRAPERARRRRRSRTSAGRGAVCAAGVWARTTSAGSAKSALGPSPRMRGGSRRAASSTRSGHGRGRRSHRGRRLAGGRMRGSGSRRRRSTRRTAPRSSSVGSSPKRRTCGRAVPHERRAAGVVVGQRRLRTRVMPATSIHVTPFACGAERCAHDAELPRVEHADHGLAGLEAVREKRVAAIPRAASSCRREAARGAGRSCAQAASTSTSGSVSHASIRSMRWTGADAPEIVSRWPLCPRSARMPGHVDEVEVGQVQVQRAVEVGVENRGERVCAVEVEVAREAQRAAVVGARAPERPGARQRRELRRQVDLVRGGDIGQRRGPERPAGVVHAERRRGRRAPWSSARRRSYSARRSKPGSDASRPPHLAREAERGVALGERAIALVARGAEHAARRRSGPAARRRRAPGGRRAGRSRSRLRRGRRPPPARRRASSGSRSQR